VATPEAPRPETPCHVESGTVVARNAAIYLDWICQKNKDAGPGIRWRISTLTCTFIRHTSISTLNTDSFLRFVLQCDL
jgi:hypothetical protein